MVNVGLNNLPFNRERSGSMSYLMQIFLIFARHEFPLHRPAGWVDGAQAVALRVGWAMPPDSLKQLRDEFKDLVIVSIFGMEILETPAETLPGFLFAMISDKGAEGIALRPDFTVARIYKTDGIYNAITEKDSLDEKDPE